MTAETRKRLRTLAELRDTLTVAIDHADLTRDYVNALKRTAEQLERRLTVLEQRVDKLTPTPIQLPD